jgi:DNA polymerase-3 subunit alpha
MKPAIDTMIERGVANGTPRDVLEKISKQIVEFASYCFNKGHSAAYGFLAYQTAYLKAHYPLQFMCSLINSEENSQKHIVPFIKECERMGIKVLPPDIRYSKNQWIIEGKNLRMSLSYIKYVGDIAIGDCSTLQDILSIKPKLNKRVVKSHYGWSIRPHWRA